MKTIYLIFSRLKGYYTRNKAIFLLFLFGGAISSFVVASFYGQTMALYKNQVTSIADFRKYEVFYQGEAQEDLTRETSFSIEDIGPIVENSLFENVMAERRLTPAGEKDQIGVVTFWKGEQKFVRLYGTTDPHSLKDNEIIVDRTSERDLGETVILQDKEFQVVGKYTGDGYYISFDAFEALGGMAQKIAIVAVPETEKETSLIEEYLNNIFSDSRIAVVAPHRLVQQIQMDAQRELLPIFLCYFIAVSSFLLLLRYLLGSFEKDNLISMIVGAPKSDIIVFTFWECFLLCMTSSVLGLVFYSAFSSVFSFDSIAGKSFHFTIFDYMIVLFITLITTLIILIPFIARYRRETLFDLHRKIL